MDFIIELNDRPLMQNWLFIPNHDISIIFDKLKVDYDEDFKQHRMELSNNNIIIAFVRFTKEDNFKTSWYKTYKSIFKK